MRRLEPPHGGGTIWAGPRARSLVHVTVPVGQRTGPIRDAVVHRSRHIDGVHGTPRTSPPRTRVEDTVLDLAQVSADLDEAFNWLCRAVGRQLTTDRARPLAALAGAATRVALARRTAKLALDDVSDGARSVLERRYITGVERAHGLPAGARQARTVSRRPDAVRGQPLRGGESRGRARRQCLASRRAALGRQPPRQRARAVGILTVRYNWADVTQRPCFVAAQVAGLLQARGIALAPRPCGPQCRVRQRDSSAAWAG